MHCNPGVTHEKCHIGKQMVRARAHTQIFIAQSSCRVAAAYALRCSTLFILVNNILYRCVWYALYLLCSVVKRCLLVISVYMASNSQISHGSISDLLAQVALWECRIAVIRLVHRASSSGDLFLACAVAVRCSGTTHTTFGSILSILALCGSRSLSLSSRIVEAFGGHAHVSDDCSIANAMCV